jgi:hypothetical protein
VVLSEQILYPVDPEDSELPTRPKTRADCARVPRPCPYVSCRHNLFLDVEKKNITLNFEEPEDMHPLGSCALDVAEQGGLTSQEIATLMSLDLSKEVKLEDKAIRKLRGYRTANLLNVIRKQYEE